MEAGKAVRRALSRRLLATALRMAIVFCLAEGIARVASVAGLITLPETGVAGYDLVHGGQPPGGEGRSERPDYRLDLPPGKRLFRIAAPPPERRLYVPDRHLLVRMRSNAELTYDRSVRLPGKPRRYTVRTNTHGFRSAPFVEQKRPGVVRIVCLGDSSTFGMNVEQDDAYPQVLGSLLEAAYPGRFEVWNMAVPGYSSRQGVELLEREVLDYEPDVVTFAFGTNDRFWRRPLSDEALIVLSQSLAGGLLFHARAFADRSYAFRALRAGALRVGERIPDRAAAARPRVSLEELERNLVRAHVALSGRAVLILLNADFYGTDAVEAMRRAAIATLDPLIDLPALLAGAKRALSEEIERRNGLPPARPREGAVLVRVIAPAKSAVVLRRQRIDGRSEDVPMRDDGGEGDQRAGDGIWSCYVPAAPGGRVVYLYAARDSRPAAGAAADELRPEASADSVLAIRQLRVTQPVAPIEIFGDLGLMSDATHPGEAGHRIIAQRLFEVVTAHTHVRKLLEAGRHGGGR